MPGFVASVLACLAACSSEGPNNGERDADDATLSCPEPGTLPVGDTCEDRRGDPCDADSECGIFDVCRSGTCRPIGADLDLLLVADHPPAARTVSEDDGITLSPASWGGAIFDGDGDRVLEVFSGGPAGNNRLLDGSMAPAALELPPEIAELGVYLAHALDLDGDLDHELLVAAPDRLLIIDWRAGRPEVTDLSHTLPSDDPCNPGMMMPVDLDDDGDLDLYVACLIYHEGNVDIGTVAFENPPRENFAILQDAPDDWRFDDTLSAMDQGSTLAVGVLDWNDDGALDLVLPNDHSVGDGIRNPFLQEILGPGAVFVWTPGGFERRPIYGEEDTNFGNWMGISELQLASGRHLYMSDVGANAVIDLETDPPTRVRRPEALTLLPNSRGESRAFGFGWGIVASDLDRNGRQDVFAARGLVAPQLIPDLEVPDSFATDQSDLLYVVADDGTFQLVVELQPSEQAEDGWIFQSRGAHVTDLDHDGAQDLVIFGLYFHESDPLWRPGFLRYRVASTNHDRTPPACTLIPDPWLVPSVVGYGIREVGTDFFRTENVGGQIRFGTSPWPVSTHGSGTLRFASGAKVDFDCRGEAGPIVVSEPENWLDVSRAGSRTRVCIDADGWGSEPTAVSLADADGVMDLTPDADGCWVGETTSDGFYVRIDERYVTHRYE